MHAAGNNPLSLCVIALKRALGPDRQMEEKRRAILAEIPRLRRYARALLRERDAADDLVQDCLERALSRLENWQTGESPRRWLFTIMYHLFLDEVRRDKRRQAALATGAGEYTLPAASGDVQASVEIMQALQSLSPERRAAIVTVAVEGLSYAEAAAVLGVPAGTLMSRIARGREELRALMDDAQRRRTIRVVDK
jgi:RNA polymerase sigma-70 factor (ECF subfamily)